MLIQLGLTLTACIMCGQQLTDCSAACQLAVSQQQMACCTGKDGNKEIKSSSSMSDSERSTKTGMQTRQTRRESTPHADNRGSTERNNSSSATDSNCTLSGSEPASLERAVVRVRQAGRGRR